MCLNRRLRTLRARLARRWYALSRRRRRADKPVWGLVSFGGLVAAAFVFVLHSLHVARAELREVTCLALNVYYEARGEPAAGRYAVAEVTMNRVASPRYPDGVCEVVYQQNWDRLRKRNVAAFSWTELERLPAPAGAAWRAAWRAAEEVYHGRREVTLARALHYHAAYARPSWSRGQAPIARIGSHVFYR